MQVLPIAYDTLNIPQATLVQNELRRNLNIAPIKKVIKTIAGADISLNRFSNVIYAGIVVLDYETLLPIGYSMVESETNFPYVPGYLAFREVPALVKVIDQLPVKPDVIMVDGHGIAHPRRMGIAAHLGAVCGIPTLGCAKKKLYGKYIEPELLKGSYTSLHTKDETIGYVLRSKNNVKPVFISPGNNMDLSDSLNIAHHCTLKHRLPEPTRRAHEFVNLFRTGRISSGYHEIASQLLF
ncbi:endonuclease V [Olivibacter sp. SDN3]|uniref:deoxyribonuclease V n=1 Tax=Olivibacter sp. SDN3 TaxID=2764720 RepID=UPI0016511E91|nr:deoxyribonuclease V [Olivibacter sp. SDN3]QNL49609.1 endonuclease V [Olivibacter sp. SDN3]